MSAATWTKTGQRPRGGPTDHVALAGGLTPAARKRPRRRFKASPDELVLDFESPQRSETDGGSVASRRSPEMAPASSTAAAQSGRVAGLRYG
jgi:hypothetical protein